jgi:type II secretory pathway component PulJ
MSPRQQQGFTLLEVLLAGFILFLTIAAMTMVYRGALLSSSKAEQSLEIISSVPFIRVIVTEQLRASSDKKFRQSSGSYGSVEFSWEAVESHIGRPSKTLLQLYNEQDTIEYSLWDVTINLTKKGKTFSHKFSEISW